MDGPAGLEYSSSSPRLVRTQTCSSRAAALAGCLLEWRWFERADKLPFFFAGIWRPWTGDRGTKKAPNIGDHVLFSIMTTEPNGVVEAVHEKAMPVMLMTADDVDSWLSGGSVEDALAIQKPTPEEAIVMRPPETKSV